MDNNSYDHIAELYKQSKLLGFRKHVEAFTLFQLLGDVKGKTVLDLACGEGIYTRMMKQMGAARVVGVDLSAEMVKLAEREEEKEPIGCEYLVGDASVLGKIGDFDIVTASYLLNYARNRQMLKSMCTTAAVNLHEGGRFIGVNDNPLNAVEHYGSYAAYGFIKESPSGRMEGSPVKYIFTNPDGTTFGFDNFFLSPSTYAAVFEEVGLRGFNWQGPFLSEEGQKDAQWDWFMEHPPIIGFSSWKQ